MIWLRRVGMFLDHKFAFSTDSNCTESLDVFSLADALQIKYPLKPITIYATKQEIYQYWYRLGLIRISEIREAQAMMGMVEIEYLTNLHEISTKSHRYRTNAHGPRVLVLATQSRQRCSSFERSYDWHGTEIYEGRCNPNGSEHQARFNGIWVQNCQGRFNGIWVQKL